MAKIKTWTKRTKPGFYKVYMGEDHGGRYIVGKQIGVVCRGDSPTEPWMACSNSVTSSHRTRNEAVVALAARAAERTDIAE